MIQLPPTKPALDIDAVLDRFENAWQGEAAPALEQFLKGDAAGSRQLLIELIRIDLDHRWRRAAQSQQLGREVASALPCRPKIEDYLKRFSQLGPLEEVPTELVAEEYCVRHCWGDRPSQEEYQHRFPRQAAMLRSALAEVDAELMHERPTVARAAPKPLTSVEAFLDMLRDKPLLNPWQLDQLTMEHLRQPFADPRALARNLLERNWLTPYQVNQILLGHGQELVLGQYVLLERLGEGLRGKVCKAWHCRLKRMAALKIIKKEFLDEEEAVRRFYHEMQAVSQLSHPNVVHAYDAGPIEQTHFLAMEYVEGIDLNRLLKQSGPLPIGLACEYVRQVALGLQHAHEHGLVHRDIKPANLLLTASGDGGPGLVKILDMGLARLRKKSRRDQDSSGTLTQEGTVMGTPDFMSPEQALDPRTADIRTDLYSLGCTFFCLLTGQPPFPGGKLLEKVERHQKEPPPPVEQLRPETPAFVSDVVRRLLAKQPAHRYSTPAELAAALAPIVARFGPQVSPLTSLPSSAGPPKAPTRRVGHRSQRSLRPLRWLLAAAATGGMVLSIALGMVLLGFKGKAVPTATSTRNTGLVRIVDAHDPWQDMYLDLRAGDLVTFRATGKWRMSGALPECAADGLPNVGRERNLVPDWPAMCLLARIDGEDIPIPLGSHQTVRIKQSGRLFLQANAVDLASCSGSLKVEIAGGSRSSREVPGWQFGYGHYEGGVKYFHALRYYPGHGWQGGLKLPDVQTGWVWFQGDMGRPGDLQHCAIRRWIVPHDCTVTISGALSHLMDAGDGVTGRIVVQRLGEVGSWVVLNSTLETNVPGLELKQGDVVDVVVDCRSGPEQDLFSWRPVLFQVERTKKK